MLLQNPFMTITRGMEAYLLDVLCRADHEYTANDIARMMGTARSIGGIRNGFDRLVAQGVVIQRQHGNTFTYQLNRKHLAVGPILELARLRGVFLDRLTERCATIPDLVYAALFGSAARGEMRVDSDIDLLFIFHGDRISDDSQEALMYLALDASDWTGNDVRPITFVEAEKHREQLFTNIYDEGVVLFGDRGYLRDWRAS